MSLPLIRERRLRPSGAWECSEGHLCDRNSWFCPICLHPRRTGRRSPLAAIALLLIAFFLAIELIGMIPH